MISSLFNLSVIAEIVCFVAAIILLNKKSGVWQLFIPFLFITLVTETTGWYIFMVEKQSNHWLYYVFNTLESAFYAGMFISTGKLFFNRRILILAITLITFAFCNYLAQEIFKVIENNNYTKVFGDISALYVSCLFFYVKLREDIHSNLLKNEFFWFAIGVLFGSLGSAIADIFRNLLTNVHNQTGVPLFTYIMNALDVLLYGSFIVAFLCRRINTK